jgi:hypothetical protein
MALPRRDRRPDHAVSGDLDGAGLPRRVHRVAVIQWLGLLPWLQAEPVGQAVDPRGDRDGRPSTTKEASAADCRYRALWAKLAHRDRLERREAVIRNGLYFYSSKALDGVVGGADGVMVLRDCKMLGGTPYFYFIGTYTSSGGKWKGELTDQEHTPAPAGLPTTGKGLVAFGFNGTYTDDGAQFYATALVGKWSLQYHATLRLLVAD